MMKNLLPYKDKVPNIAKNVFIAPTAIVIGDVEIKENSSVWFGSIIRGDVNYIRIGKNTNIQDMTMIHVTTAKYPTIIGDNVTIGHKAMIHGCIIEDFCLIGMNATILDGAKISKYTIVAAGALVPPNKEFPPNVLLKGSPAKIARELKPEEIEEIHYLSEHYSRLASTYMDIPFI